MACPYFWLSSENCDKYSRQRRWKCRRFKHLPLWVPYSEACWRITSFQSFLSWHACKTSPADELVHSMMSDKYVLRHLPLDLFPSIFPDKDKFSNPPWRITWPRNVIFLFLIVASSFLFTPVVANTNSLVFRSIHDIFNILLRNHISTASRRFFIADDMFHVSQP